LTTLIGAVESAELPVIEAAARKKQGWMPVLTVLFLISYGLMTMLIVEQGQTIESQRALIRELFRDSKELSSLKLNVHRQQTVKGLGSVAPHKIAPRTPSAQVPSRKTPSSQADSQFGTQNRAAQQKPFRKPPKPASDLTDSSRTLLIL